MKLSVAAVLVSLAGVSAYSVPSRRDIRSLGQKSLPVAASRKVGASMKMEGE